MKWTYRKLQEAGYELNTLGFYANRGRPSEMAAKFLRKAAEDLVKLYHELRPQLER